MKNLSLLAATVGAIVFSAATPASTYFFDSFNSEHTGSGALNYNSFNQWTVSDGTVDLIGNGYFDFYPGNGLFVDLDGSTSQAGTLTSSGIPLGVGNYFLTFDLGGNQRGSSPDTVHVDIPGIYSNTFIKNSGDPLVTETVFFTVTSPGVFNISFRNEGGDNIGAVLDNVQVSGRNSVPDAGATALMLGFGAMGLAVLRRKPAR